MVTSGKTSIENMQKKSEKGMLVRNPSIKAYRKQRTKKDTHTHTHTKGDIKVLLIGNALNATWNKFLNKQHAE